ncbi:MAG: HD domain-containing protein [Desulfovibrionaceae bacterium]|nr:HD domain-containing protein [Desulfovibrionaceae bacterium]
MVEKRLSVFIALLLSFLFHNSCHAVAELERRPSIKYKNILILHSYAPDYAWTRDVNNGIMAVLDDLDWTNTLRVEYMDSKHTFYPQYLQDLVGLYTNKYQEFHFDGIIVSDNNALNFLETYGRPLFPVATVVATGINSVDSVAKNTIARSVVLTMADHAETLRQAIRQNPEAKTAYIISDFSTTGRAIVDEVQAIIAQMPTNIEYKFVPPMAFEDLVEYVGTIDPNDFIYLFPYARDFTGRSFRQGYAATFLSRTTQLPIYGSWDFQIGTGITGGRVVSAFRQGELAAKIMIELLETGNGSPLFHKPASTFKNIYDFKQISRLNIPTERLPENVEFINKPESFYVRHQQVIIPSLAIITLLSIFLLLLSQNLVKQKTINRKDRAIIALNHEIIDTQRELVTTLGEVIENHSKETGNHVKRVAKISRFLGTEIGLSYEQLELLEAASPLHDVGKIGISEIILHKPGKLTDKEFETIKKHTTIGRDILKTSNRELLASGCSIAYQHHERWDGSGYPNGLAGEEIDIFARITTLADIYDALSSERSYKKAWAEAKVLDYIRNENGKFFDPQLVNIFLDNIEEIRAIRRQYGPEKAHLT